MKDYYNKYLNNEIVLEKWQKIGIICLIIVFSGMFGWLYEFIFYFFNSGMKTFYYRGANFLPWINIYATGSIMILILTRKYKKKPLILFLIACISTGILEYISGFLMYQFGDGIRCWNYNNEILNFGNIDGFVCLRSVLSFGLSALLLMYGIVPMFVYLSLKCNKKRFLIISISICSIFLLDEIYNLIIARIFDLPRARDIYSEIGYKYMDYYSNQ